MIEVEDLENRNQIEIGFKIEGKVKIFKYFDSKWSLEKCISEIIKEYDQRFNNYYEHFIYIEHDDGTRSRLQDFLRKDKKNKNDISKFGTNSIIFPDISGKSVFMF